MFHHLYEHYGEGGSFRQLIYGRMSFGESGYRILMGQGLHLSNLLNCARENEEVTKALLDCYT